MTHGGRIGMRMKMQDELHGAALMPLIKHADFVALNRAPDKASGHYAVNSDIRVLVKIDRSSPPCNFRIGGDDIVRLQSDKDSQNRVFLVLVCGGAVCALDWDKLIHSLDFSPTRPGQQTLSVEPSGGARVKILSKKVRQTLPRGLLVSQARYPDKLLGRP
jgi:hypothetical protein